MTLFQGYDFSGDTQRKIARDAAKTRCKDNHLPALRAKFNDESKLEDFIGQLFDTLPVNDWLGAERAMIAKIAELEGAQ